MPMFTDFLSGLRGEDGSITIGENFESDATAAYDADMAGSSAAFAEAQTQIEALKLELQAAQAANWVLVQGGYGLDGSAPGEGDTESDPDNAQTDVDEDDDLDYDDDDFLGDPDEDEKDKD